MKFLLINSTKDIAANNLTEELFKSYNFTEIKPNLYKLQIDALNEIYLKKINDIHIHTKKENICNDEIDFDQIIFLSRHSTLSKTKSKCMTVHAIGNWGIAELGGNDFTIVKTDPILIRSLLLNLKENKNPEIKQYEVKQEATHHGPYLEIPTIFYEIGSIDNDWKNKDVSKYMIRILIDTIKNYNKKKIILEQNWIETVGVGGSHYCTRFNKLTFNRNKKYCFGHVVPSYAIKNITPEILEDAKNKSNSKKIIYEEDII